VTRPRVLRATGIDPIPIRNFHGCRYLSETPPNTQCHTVDMHSLDRNFEAITKEFRETGNGKRLLGGSLRGDRARVLSDREACEPGEDTSSVRLQGIVPADQDTERERQLVPGRRLRLRVVARKAHEGDSHIANNEFSGIERP
jgi:hypothetical protein